MEIPKHLRFHVKVNIFVLDTDPVVSAQNHADWHVKWAIELHLRILRTVVQNKSGLTYQQTHFNGPTFPSSAPWVLWAGKTYRNYCWMTIQALELCREYNLRFGEKLEAEYEILKWLVGERDRLLFDQADRTPQPVTIPEEYRLGLPGDYDVVKSYRKFYMSDYPPPARWNKTKAPEWFHDETTPILQS